MGVDLICLEARNLHKCYQDSDQQIRVLSGADICIKQGELVSITGQSGCGKSTLLHILSLLDAPDSGMIKLFGNTVSSKDKDVTTIRNRDLGFVFQFHYLIDDLTAIENVAIPALIAGLDYPKSMFKAKEILDKFELGHRIKHYPNQLSGGEQQRVALARALINNPKIVFADEPTGNLDPKHSHEVWDIILDLNKHQAQTFVIVTHDHELAAKTTSQYKLSEGILSS